MGVANRHLIDIVVQGQNNAGPALNSAATQHATLTKQVVAGSKQMRTAMETAMAPGTAKRWAAMEQFERLRDTLTAMAQSLPKNLTSGVNMKGIFREIDQATNTANLDAVGMKLAVLTSKAEILGTLGGAGMRKFGQEVRNATTLPQLAALEAKIAAAGAAAAGAAPKVFSLAGAIKAMGASFGGMSAGLQGMIGMFAGMAIFTVVMKTVEGIKHLVMGTLELANAQRQLHVESLEMGLSVDTLETYKVAAAETGVELGNLRMGMRMLAMSMERNPEAFRKLGIEVRTASGEMQSLDVIMPQLMDLFAGMTNETQRLELAGALMGGRMGARLIPLLTQGSAAMRAYAAEGRRLGVIMDEMSDRALTDLARQTAVANLAMEGMTAQLQLSLIPAFLFTIGVATKFVTVMQWLGTGGKGYDESKRIKEYGRLWNEAFLAKLGYLGLVNAFATPTRVVEPVPQGMELATAHTTPTNRITQMVQQFLNEVRNLDKAAEEAARKARKRAEDIAEIAKAMGYTTVEATRAYEQMEKLKSLDFKNNIIKSVEELTRRLAGLPGLVAEVIRETNAVVGGGSYDVLRETESPYHGYLDPKTGQPMMPRGMPKYDPAMLSKALMVGVDKQPKAKIPTPPAIDPVTEAQIAMDKILSLAEASRAGLDAVFQGLQSGFAATFEGLVRGTMNLKQALDAIWRSIVSSIISELARLAAAAVFKFLLSLLGGGGFNASILGGGSAWAGSIPVPTGAGAVVGMNAMRPATTTNTTNVTIQTFSPRDVLMQYTSPGGVLRNAQTRVALAGEY